MGPFSFTSCERGCASTLERMRGRRDVVPPGPGQESVWDYPRPPRAEPSTKRVEVWLGGERIASTTRAIRILETSHPPAWYLPREDFAPGSLIAADGTSYCEWKGVAHYLDVSGGDRRESSAAWTYPLPTRGFEQLREHVSLYPGRMDSCTVDGEVVRAQEGGFYGGWITDDVVGPFKVAPGSRGW